MSKKTFDFKENVLYDPQIARRIIKPLLQCMKHVNKEYYTIIRKGSCAKYFLELIKDIVNPKTRIICFTEETIRVYKAPTTVYMSIMNRKSYPSFLQFVYHSGIFTDINKNRDVSEDVENIFRRAFYCSTSFQSVDILEEKRRSIGMPYNLDEEEYGLLLLPRNRSIVIAYEELEPEPGETDPYETELYDRILKGNFTTKFNR